MIKLLFWAFVALDLAALLFFAVLALAAAGSAKTAPTALALTMLAPALPLVGSIGLFVRARSPLWRGLAFALAAAPLCLVVVSVAYNDARIRAHSNAQGELTFFESGPQRELAEAIRRQDARAVAALATRANVNAVGMEGMTPLVLALRQLRSAPDGSHDVLKALLAAGADPNLGTPHERPLEMALQVARRTGPAPVAMLLAAGAKPNLPGASGAPIFFAAAGLGAHPDTLALLVGHGADLRATGPGGETVLVYASTASSWRAVRYLLDQGVDWQQVRSPRGLSLREMVDEAVRQRQARAPTGGKPGDDDGLQAVVDFLRSR